MRGAGRAERDKMRVRGWQDGRCEQEGGGDSGLGEAVKVWIRHRVKVSISLSCGAALAVRRGFVVWQ